MRVQREDIEMNDIRHQNQIIPQRRRPMNIIILKSYLQAAFALFVVLTIAMYVHFFNVGSRVKTYKSPDKAFIHRPGYVSYRGRTIGDQMMGSEGTPKPTEIMMEFLKAKTNNKNETNIDKKH